MNNLIVNKLAEKKLIGLELTNFLADFGQTKTSAVITEVVVLMVAQVQSNWNPLLSELSHWIQLSRGEYLLSYSTAAD